MILCGGKGWGGEDKPRLSSQGQTKVLTQRENTGASCTRLSATDDMAPRGARPPP